MSRTRAARGFTLVEMLVVIGVIGILVSIAIPNITAIRNKAKEAQVKTNLHNIQVAIERYSTDNDGCYPPWLYGGDVTDSWTLPQSYWDAYLKTKTFSFGKGDSGTGQPTWVAVAQPGDGDALLMSGYITSYPENPFTLRAIADSRDQSQKMVTQVSGAIQSQRNVGGMFNDLMWEISGGPPKNTAPTPTNHPGWALIYPAVKHFQASNIISDSGDTDHSNYLVGNFYYYSVNQQPTTSWGDYDPNNVDTTVDPTLRRPPVITVGYKLIGYGSNHNDGMDLYDVYGEFAEHCRTSAAAGSPVDTGPGGPDGIPDGAILVLSSDKNETPANPNQ
jgi:prepilin-type N-terminal cleavage/methylation domain-containing protein